MAIPTAFEWKNILVHVRNHYPNLTRHWFDQLHPGELKHGVLDVRCANDPQFRYLSTHCARPFTEAAQAETAMLVSIRFSAAGNGHNAEVIAEGAPDNARAPVDEPQHIRPNPDYTFDEFVVGPSNRLAHAAGIAASDAPGEAYNPLFLHGPVGLGKTHLLQAIGQRALAHKPSLEVRYLTCESFINHFIEAIERGALHQFRYQYRHVDILVIDDIQFLAKQERTQEEFFHTFNTLYQERKQIVLSADCSPREIPSLEDRLVSRFNWGLVARIDPPCLETRTAIVRKKAKLRKILLPEKVAHYIASEVDRNTRELEGAITKVDALSQELGLPITLDTARKALSNGAVMTRQVSIPEILDAVSLRYSVKKSELRGKRRPKSIVLPRQVCMSLARELTLHSLEEIGNHFGGRDHTTVLHAVRLINTRKQDNDELSATLYELKHQLLRNAES